MIKVSKNIFLFIYLHHHFTYLIVEILEDSVHEEVVSHLEGVHKEITEYCQVHLVNPC